MPYAFQLQQKDLEINLSQMGVVFAKITLLSEVYELHID
jgi:hypothetical protein